MIPKVNGIEKGTEGKFVLPEERISFYGEQIYVKVLRERLEKRGVALRWEQVQEEKDAAIVIRLNRACVDLRAENARAENVQIGSSPGAYSLHITPQQIIAAAADEEGIANALTTLYWKLREGNGICGCVFIEDTPVYSWRGFHLDVSRHFFDAETVKSMIEQCALRKMNRLHWHISDDQGFRIESERFPKLNKIGSWRKESDGSTYGGFYTRDEVKEIVAYAKERGLEIVPEIDMPGHVSAMLAAYPQLSCSGEEMCVPVMAGIHPRILCAGKDETLRFVYELLDDMIELFPSVYVHIGGDEAPKSEWQKCPACQARMHSEGLKDEEELQAWFTKKVLEHLQKKGKTGICWNESMKSGTLAPEAVVQYWDEEEGAGYCRELAKGERKCIYSFTPAFYYDYIPAMAPMRRTFWCEPVLRDGSVIAADNLLGMEAELWSEQIFDRTRLEQMAFPRMFVVAEKTWGRCEDYEEFLQRCEQETQMLSEDGIAHFTVQEADPQGDAQKAAVLAEWKPKLAAVHMAGASAFEDIICRLVRGRIEGMMSENEVEELMRELKA